MDNVKQKTVTGFFWRLMQNLSAQIVSFVVSIVLARLLIPSDYGLIAMVTVVTNIAMVFINTGFSSALIQKKDVTELEINTLFFAGTAMAAIIYLTIFIGAPMVAVFYKEQQLIELLRAQGLIVIIGALYSVPQAMIVRRMEFKRNFVVYLTGATVQGIVGITLAKLGFGVWTLVFHSLTYGVVCGILTWCVAKWKPQLKFSFEALKSMFSFSMKMLLAGLIDVIFNNIRSIIIGKQYSSADLAYYNRGYQFPTLFMTQIDGAMMAVLFTSLSKLQNDWEYGLRALRRSIKTSIYICAPLLAGLFAVAKPMVLLLLTEKWAASIEYIRLSVFICVLWPLSAKRNALNALGKSGVSLLLNIIGKGITVTAILLTYKHSVRMLIIGTIAAGIISQTIATVIYEKYLGYKIWDQFADFMPPIFVSAIMALCVYSIQLLKLSNLVTLIIQIPVGIIIYILLSIIFKLDSFKYLLGMVKNKLAKQ